MTQLTITSAPTMGPLEVSVYAPDGDPIEFTLSSGMTARSLSVQPGRYTVVAKRPNGSRLRQTIVVGAKDASVALLNAVGATPDEFMESEVERGEIELASDDNIRSGAPLLGVFGDILGRAKVSEAFLSTLHGDKLLTSPALDIGTASMPKPLALRGWRFDGGRWLALDSATFAQACSTLISDDFFKLKVRPLRAQSGEAGEVLSFGLLDDAGFGPLVILPPFLEPVELTFLAKGVLAQASDRGLTPGHQRVPVAIFTPGAHALADFLSALSTPATPSAKAIWDQAAPTLAVGSEGDVARALDVLITKFQQPAEALVAAHYVLRFLPKRLPLDWAINLIRVIPCASDGPVIAAWTWIYNRPRDATDSQVDSAMAENISLALLRPVTLFARTRGLLLDARRLLSADTRSDELWRTEEIFRRAGAAAGGLESFWGRAPDLPGSQGQAQPGPDLDQVLLANDTFMRN